EAIETGTPHGADDVDDHMCAWCSSRARARRRRRGERGRGRRRARRQDEAGCEQEQHERDCGGQKEPPVLEEELRHVASVPEKSSRVCDAFVLKVNRNRHTIGTETAHTCAHLAGTVPNPLPPNGARERARELVTGGQETARHTTTFTRRPGTTIVWRTCFPSTCAC